MRRKFVIINIILLLVCLFSFGQNQNQFGAQIDSIQNLIQDNPNDDIDKVQQLNELARFYFYNKQEKEGFIATKKALKLSEKNLKPSFHLLAQQDDLATNLQH